MAEKFANYFILFSIAVVVFLLVRVKPRESDKTSQISGKLLSLGWLGVVFAVIFTFRPIFTAGPAAWGDVPYYHQDAFKEFFAEPLVWEARGRLGIVNDLYWIYPLMFLYKSLGAFVGLGNDVVIRLIFYFPAVIFTFLSPWLLTRYFKLPPTVSLFTSLVYSLSTYYILVVDGGQVGVALAYGLFPFALLGLVKLSDKNTTSQFFSSLISFMLLVVADVRFAIIAVLTHLVWRGAKRAHLKTLVFFGVAVLGLSAYWLIPAFLIEPTTGSGARSGVSFVSFLNPLFLYSPHWPLNEFGKIVPIPWYFAGVPFLVLGGLWLDRTRQVFTLFFCYLFFVFLAKGETGFLGNIYSQTVDAFPLGGAFRDSTKFFAPLTLFAGMLIGQTVQNLQQRLGRLSLPIFILAFAYLLFLIHPALLGKMRGVLQGRDTPSAINTVASKVSAEKSFLRTVWFPERHPQAFHTEAKPALDAKSLVGYRPFASLNTGTLDVFNFLHEESSLDWLRLIGTKYLIYPGDTRKANLNSEEQEDWDNLLRLVESNSALEKTNWSIDIPVFEIKESKPRIFGVKQAVVVVGSDDIYKKILSEDKKFSATNQGFVFVEDGKADVQYLMEVASDSAVLVFNQADEQDLVFTFLQRYFAAIPLSDSNQWAVRPSKEYLKWKYELLTKGVETFEFDYGKGIAFSSVKGEKIIFNLKVPQKGEYVLGIRILTNKGYIEAEFGGIKKEISTAKPGNLEWDITENLGLEEGNVTVTLENQAELSAVNTVSLILQEEWKKSKDSAQSLVSRMKSYDTEKGIGELSKALGENSWQEFPTKFESPVEYSLSTTNDTNWVVFTDTYNKDWKIEGAGGVPSLPFYSMVNGFYIPDEGQHKIVFAGQDKVRPGLYISLLSLGIVLAIYFKRVLLPRFRKK